MADGTKGTPGLPQFQPMMPTTNQTQANPQNIFDMIKQGYSQSYSSVLPYVQAQLGEKSKAAEPQIAAIQKQGEMNAASATSDAGARGMRGSDIEAAGQVGARNAASDQAANLRSQLAMQEAQTMAESMLKTYGFDIEQNQQLYNNLAMAMGQELSQQRELEMREKELKEAKKLAKSQSKMGMWTALLGAGAQVGAAAIKG